MSNILFIFSLSSDLSNNRGRMQPKLAERPCLFRAEMLQEIVESAGKATNGGLKTVDEATVENETEKVSPPPRHYVLN